MDEQIALIDQALAEKPDAFVVVPVHPTAINAALRKVYASGIPLAGLLNRFSEPGPVCYVGADDCAIGVELARYLFQHLGGRGDVVIMEGVPSSVTSNDRVRGFQEALKEFPDVRLVRKIRGDYLRDPAKRAAHELLREGVRFDAVLAANDDMAIGMIAALEEAGVKATVVGVNAIPEAITAIKEGKLLATVDFNSKDMSTIATEAVLRHLRGEKVPAGDHAPRADRRSLELRELGQTVRSAGRYRVGGRGQELLSQVSFSHPASLPDLDNGTMPDPFAYQPGVRRILDTRDNVYEHHPGIA